MYRALRADEIELRVGTVAKNKSGFSLLCYKDARCDQNILDEVHGAEYWQRDHKEVKGVLYGGVGIFNKELGEWIWKWDAGTESNTEAQKGEASDSFKRACFNLGIGRELYTSPFIWIKGHMDDGRPDQKFVGGLGVALIEYEETEAKRTIVKMQIKDSNDVVVFSYGPEKAGKGNKKEDKPAAMTKEGLSEIVVELCDEKRFRVADICAKSGVDKLEDMTEEQLSKWIDWLEAK